MVCAGSGVRWSAVRKPYLRGHQVHVNAVFTGKRKHGSVQRQRPLGDFVKVVAFV